MLVAAIALCGCTRAGDPAPPANDNAEAVRIPYDNSTGFLYGYRLRIPRAGPPTWNGMPVDAPTLVDYLHTYAGLPRGADPLYVEFEPGTLPARVAWVRRQIIDSGLCRKDRCREVGWNVPRPVVN